LKKLAVLLLRIAGATRSTGLTSQLVAAHTIDASSYEYVAILKSQIFDPQWYLDMYPDVAAARRDPLLHYIAHGAREGRDPHPLFSTTWYLTRYPDVALAGMNPLYHYIQYGSRPQEGRDPHPEFSTSYYYENNPEIVARGENPLCHYLRVGRSSGRLPFDPNASYLRNVTKEQQRRALQLPKVLQHISAMLYKPSFHIFVTGSGEEAFSATKDSINHQVYERWSTSRLDWGKDEIGVVLDEGTFAVFLTAGDVLDHSALYELANAINANPSADIIYCDEDKLSQNGERTAPYYKPDWSPDTLESHNFIGPGACFSGALVLRVLSVSQSYYDFVLRATELTSRIDHVRAVVCHRSTGAADLASPKAIADDLNALAGRLQRTGREGVVNTVRPNFACYDLKVSLASRPLVSIVIPTAGKVVDVNGKRIDLICNCVDKIRKISTYTELEFIVVDNGDLSAQQESSLRGNGCRRLTYSERNFNISKKLNLGAKMATGTILLLLNDDIEPLVPDWIERMLEHLEKAHVGVVGAKLLYSDSTVQHAGVVTNLGNPEHVRRTKPREDLGYFFSACAVRNYSAVTGACMMTPAHLYQRLGGYNEELAVSYNDVDYCLKVREAELTVVYAAKAELFHFESLSRKPTLDITEGEYFHTRWARMVTSDPYYNESDLELLPASFEVKHNQRVL
jgi:GT2 family glycosyltransferase